MNLEESLKAFNITDINVETEASIKKRYKKLMIKYHPDNYNGDDTKAKEISLALSVLRDALLKLKQYKLINSKQEQFNIVIPLSKLISIYSGESISIKIADNINGVDEIHEETLSNKDIQKHNTLIILDATITHNGFVQDFSNIQHWTISDNYEINCDLYVDKLTNNEVVLLKIEDYEKEFEFSSQAASILVKLPFNISVNIKITKRLRAEKENDSN